MKRMRTAFMSLGLALLAGVLFSDSAAAQCTGCGFEVDAEWTEDGFKFTSWTYCTHGLEIGAASCVTPEPNVCEESGFCSTELAVRLDGRAAPRQSSEYVAREAPLDVGAPTAFSAAYASLDPPSGFRDSAETNRACDGGIISKFYLWSETSAIRSTTAQLRL